MCSLMQQSQYKNFRAACMQTTKQQKKVARDTANEREEKRATEKKGMN